jgi:aminoglycoside phosphotransferase (APT) family kinase protein
MTRTPPSPDALAAADDQFKRRADANQGESAPRPGFELDGAALAAWLADQIPGFTPPLTVQQFHGGQSNPTYKLMTPDGAYVLRTRPSGPGLATAHAIDREVRVLRALAGTGVPVPAIVTECTDGSVIGRPFYIMAFIAGPIVWDLPTDRWQPAQRAAIWQAGVMAAGQLHRLDAAAIGLTDFGRPGGYVARQFRRWSDQYEYTRSGINNPDMEPLIDWLGDRLPQSEPHALIHGDLQLSNMILRPDLSAVAALLDWELSTLGNPVSDFAYFCRDYHVAASDGGFADRTDTLGLPPEREVIALWESLSCRTVGPDWPFYIVFNMFRLAAIRQGVARRIQDGTATSAHADIAARGAVTMARTAWRLAQSWS